jgi:flagellar hook assembly protein FlgD
MSVQSGPNPLRTDSTIRFELPRPADVAAEIFDASGRRVRTIAQGPHDAGTHTLVWNGTDASDRRVAAGIYFLRLRAGEETRSAKLFVVK